MTDAHGAPPRLASRPWVPDASDDLVAAVAARTAQTGVDDIDRWLHDLVVTTRRLPDVEAVNPNPAANTMNPRAEALLASGLGSRPSPGYPGAKFEMGLEAVKQIEIIAVELAAGVFDAHHAEIRVPSGAMANLFAFMATTRPGDAVIVPPATVAGHVTHHPAVRRACTGCASMRHRSTRTATRSTSTVSLRSPTRSARA